MAMKTVWFWRGPKIKDHWSAAANYASQDYPHPSLVKSEEPPTSENPFSYIKLDENDNIVFVSDDPQFEGSPKLWYIIEETQVPTDMVAIHAMCCPSFPEGTIIKIKNIERFGINPSNRVGFIRWFRRDSRMQQIYVADEWRRRRISTKLIAVADLAIISGEYGPYLNGGDITTDDGEKLREAWSNSPRLMPRVGVSEVIKNQ